jgi:hypothetical protein
MPATANPAPKDGATGRFTQPSWVEDEPHLEELGQNRGHYYTCTTPDSRDEWLVSISQPNQNNNSRKGLVIYVQTSYPPGQKEAHDRMLDLFVSYMCGGTKTTSNVTKYLPQLAKLFHWAVVEGEGPGVGEPWTRKERCYHALLAVLDNLEVAAESGQTYQKKAKLEQAATALGSLRKHEHIHYPADGNKEWKAELDGGGTQFRDERVKDMIKQAENIDQGQKHSSVFDRLEGRAPIPFDDADVERVVDGYIMATHTGEEQRGLTDVEQRKRLCLGAAWLWQLMALKRPGDCRWNFVNTQFLRVPPNQDRAGLAFHTNVEVWSNTADKGKGLRANGHVHSHIPRSANVRFNAFTMIAKHLLSNIQTKSMDFDELLLLGHAFTHNLFLFNTNPSSLSTIPMAAGVYTAFCKAIFAFLKKQCPKMPAHYMRHIALRMALECLWTIEQRVHAGWSQGTAKGGQQEQSYNFVNPDMDALLKSALILLFLLPTRYALYFQP